MFRIGMATLSLSLSCSKVLNPSNSSLRKTRSSTRDWEIPKSSKVCGTLGVNPVRTGETVATIDKPILSLLIGGVRSIIYRLETLLKKAVCDRSLGLRLGMLL